MTDTKITRSGRGRWDTDIPIQCAHGAWVYLFCCVAAGSLIGSDDGVERPMLVGTAFAGVFMVAAALAVGVWRKWPQVAVGLLVATVGVWLASQLEQDLSFMVIASLAIFPAMATIFLCKTQGFLSPGALVCGVAAVVMAAPVTAVAGGVSPQFSALIFVNLGAFFCWRTLRIAAPLARSGKWDRQELRARGLREAAVSACWTLLVVIAMRAIT